MSYSKLKKQKLEAQKVLKEATQELDQLESKLDELHEKFEASYSDLTDARACLKVGDGSATNVSQAEKRNKDIKEEITATKLDLDTQRKAVNMLADKLQIVEKDFKKESSTHHQDKAQKVLNSLSDAVIKANDAINELNRIRKEAQADGSSINTKGIQLRSEILISKDRPAGMLAMNTINSKQLQQ